MAKRIELEKNRGKNSAYSGDLKLEDDFFEAIGDSPSGIVAVDGALSIKNIQILKTGLRFVGDVTKEEYEVFGQALLRFDTAYQWIIGDYLAYGTDNNYGMATEIGEQFGRGSGTINNWTSVCRQVEISRRNENLSFKHHVIVSPLVAEDQQKWLDQAEVNGWSASRLREEIEGSAIDSAKPSPALSSVYRLQKKITKTSWQKISSEERDEIKSILRQMQRDIRKWDNSR